MRRHLKRQPLLKRRETTEPTRRPIEVRLKPPPVSEPQRILLGHFRIRFPPVPHSSSSNSALLCSFVLSTTLPFCCYTAPRGAPQPQPASERLGGRNKSECKTESDRHGRRELKGETKSNNGTRLNKKIKRNTRASENESSRVSELPTNVKPRYESDTTAEQGQRRLG